MKNITLIFTTFLFVALSATAQTNWQPLNTGVNKFFLDVHFADENHGWICGQQGLVMRTTDGGETWEELDAPPNNVYSTIFFINNLEGWAVGTASQIIHTTDGGDTWEFQQTNVQTNLGDIFFMDENTGWIVGGDNGTFPSLIKQRLVLKTTDGGNSWQEEINESYQTLLSAVHFADYNNGWAVGESGVILHSSDGGSTWIEQMSDMSYHFNSVYFASENKGWVTAEYLGLPHAAVIFRTVDGGENWTSQEFGEDVSLSDIHFTDENTGWAVGGELDNALILHTEDGGETWVEEASPVEQYLSSVHFSDMTHGWAAGYAGTLITTSTVTAVDDNISAVEETHIFPNPAREMFTVSSSKKIEKVRLMDQAGKRILETQVDGRDFSVRLGDIPAGLYVLHLETKNEVISKKLVVQ